MSTANHWLRLWHEMPNDPKWRTIARASGQPISVVLGVYLHLLVDASRNVTRGHATVTPEDVASALDVTEDMVLAILTAMQGRVLEGMHLLGWEKRQPKREDVGDEAKGVKSAAQRKAEQREREREARDALRDKGDGHDESRDVTQGHAREEKSREEKTSSVPDGTGGEPPAPAPTPSPAPAPTAPPPPPKPKTPAEEEKSRVWAALKTALVEQQTCPDVKEAGVLLGKLASKYGQDVFLAASRETLQQYRANTHTFLISLCEQAAGKRVPLSRGPSQPKHAGAGAAIFDGATHV